MMTNDIVSQVAHLIRTRDLSQKDPKEIKVQKEISAPKDEVELSSAGETYANPVTAQPDYEKDQHMKVERLKALVQKGNYKLDETMVNSIAERIARNLLT
jgi:anti-sigma28 factor (negative regulator of flagellin synthesis)